MTNFRPFEIERACKQQFLVRQKWWKVLQKGRKHCGKRGKGEIARYEQFLLFLQCFQKTCTAEKYKNQGLFGKGLTNFVWTSLPCNTTDLKFGMIYHFQTRYYKICL